MPAGIVSIQRRPDPSCGCTAAKPTYTQREEQARADPENTTEGRRMKLTHAPIVVSDQDKALQFYTEVLGFEKRADYQLPGKPRWLTVAPKGQDLEFILVQGRSTVDLGLGP